MFCPDFRPRITIRGSLKTKRNCHTFITSQTKKTLLQCSFDQERGRYWDSILRTKNWRKSNGKDCYWTKTKPLHTKASQETVTKPNTRTATERSKKRPLVVKLLQGFLLVNKLQEILSKSSSFGSVSCTSGVNCQCQWLTVFVLLLASHPWHIFPYIYLLSNKMTQSSQNVGMQAKQRKWTPTSCK